jgi:D-alanyl-D-alanine carboxypeptidase
MSHPFRNIIGIIVFVSGLYLAGQNLFGPAVAPSAIQASVARAVKCSFPSLKDESTREINLGARAFLSAYLAPDGSMEIMVEKDGHKQVPIASVTKLMTALVAMDILDQATVTTITSADLFRPADDPAQFEGGEIFTVRTLLDSLLVESSNYSAHALARLGGGQGFIQKMNEVAQNLEMRETYYSNASGLDEDSGSNFSSAYDLLTLAKKILAEQPEILAITRQASLPIVETDGREDHVAQATNELLANNHWPAEIVGGKTGTTPLAKTNLVFVLKDKATGGYLINIVLGSDDHFGDMVKLTDWVYASYDF